MEFLINVSSSISFNIYTEREKQRLFLKLPSIPNINDIINFVNVDGNSIKYKIVKVFNNELKVMADEGNYFLELTRITNLRDWDFIFFRIF